MKFGPLPVAAAAGAVVAHSHRVGKRTFKKGRVLSDTDVALLRAAGIVQVVVARTEPGEISEDAAAARVAKAVAGAGLSVTEAFTGRANLVAEVAGVVVLDNAGINEVNLVDEAITLASLPPFELVRSGQLVGTIKVIPFAVADAHVGRCEAVGRAAKIRIAGFRQRPVGLLQTRLDGTKERVLDKTSEVTAVRLNALGNNLDDEERCAHEVDALTRAIADQRHAGRELLLISGASAIVDRRDVIPAAIEQVGGSVVHFGMPVDPGNLILLGEIDGFPVLGLPGCARSPRLNGFDWVLARLLADLPVGPAEVMAMGAGGLLKEIPSRPSPRAEAGGLAASVSQVPQVAAIVLAAGQSRRMGAVNKLLAEVDGRPMVARVVDAALASRAKPVIVVTGHEAARIRAALGARDVTIVHNADYAKGLSTSLRAGLDAVPAAADGALVCLGDMPLVPSAQLDKLAAAFDPTEGRAICVPTWRGKRGNPVLWAHRFFEEMIAVTGDVGARHLIGEHGDLVVEVAMDNDRVLIDVDSPADLASITRRASA